MTVVGYRRPAPGINPDNNSSAYASTRARAPRHPAIRIEHTLSEITGPHFETGGASAIDLTRGARGEALGERIIVTGRVLDDDGRAIAGALIETWQANAAGRYAHESDQHDAPLDPNFAGAGRIISDSDGAYRLVTIKPGAYPWRNHPNAWRPQHIHFSVFGTGFAARLITQMYFPGDPLLAIDPIFQSVADPDARARLVAALQMDVTVAEYALGYRFDIVLRGRDATPPQE